jgi:hypothetical protein
MSVCMHCGGGSTSSMACTCDPAYATGRVVGVVEQLAARITALEAEVRELKAFLEPLRPEWCDRVGCDIIGPHGHVV